MKTITIPMNRKPYNMEEVKQNELLSACKYALGILTSIPKPMAEQIADILDESIDISILEDAINNEENYK